MHDTVERNRRPRRQKHWAAAAPLVGRHRRQRAEAIGAIVRASEHGMDARHLERRARVDAGDVGTGWQAYLFAPSISWTTRATPAFV